MLQPFLFNTEACLIVQLIPTELQAGRWIYDFFLVGGLPVQVGNEASQAMIHWNVTTVS